MEPMRMPGGRARWLAPLLLALAVLAPYSGMLTGSAIPIPDDIFISDLADGDFPLRVEAGRLVRAGRLPLWTPRIYTGFPLQTCAFEPLSIALFTVLPPALALGWYLAIWLLVAALGTYALARQSGASRAGGFLAGFAFSWSGFAVCQMRHPSILATVALFPAALLCLERAAGGTRDRADARALTLRRRFLWLTGFAAVFGLQLLAGFPQSAYNSALVYVALIAARCVWLRRSAVPAAPRRAGMPPSLALAVGALAAFSIGTLIGLAQVLPVWELGRLSDRSVGVPFEWATQSSYWPRNALTFLLPYVNGDVSDLTYQGSSVFWEDYGYVGLLTLLLAAGAVVLRARRFAVAFWLAAGLVAYSLVLGPATPLYRIAFAVVPGLSAFRFPTRFLFIVELALALLGGFGLTALQGLIARRTAGSARAFAAPLVALTIVAATAADLVYNNRRQNPFVDADRWLARPASAAAVLAAGQAGRVYSPGHRKQHVEVFYRSRGWSGDLGAYVAQRELLQPNSNLLHGVETLDGYAGIVPRWVVDLIGDHNRPGLLNALYRVEGGRLLAAPAFVPLLEALSTRWLILPAPTQGFGLEVVGQVGPAYLHRLPGALPRVRVVGEARVAKNVEELLDGLRSGAIDLSRTAVLHDPGAAEVVAALGRAGSDAGPAGAARVVVDRANDVVVEAVAPRGGLLLIADTWYPGWQATVDDNPAPVLRANLAGRAVVLPPGSHTVAFTFRPRLVAIGFALSAAGLALLLGTLVLLSRARGTPPAGVIRTAPNAS